MLYTVFGMPDAGKSTFARYLAKKFGGKVLVLSFEGRQTPSEDEILHQFNGGDPLEWLQNLIIEHGMEWKEVGVKSIIVDSVTAVNDAYEPISLEVCKQDDKLKNKSKAELDKMTLASIPYGMGESNRALLVKKFLAQLVKLSATKEVIVTAHTQVLTMVGSDQIQTDVVSLSIGGKAERSAASRVYLLQHSDAVIYLDATPEKIRDIQIPQRRAVVGQNGILVTKYKGSQFGKDEFFEPEPFYDIKGKDALIKTINELF